MKNILELGSGRNWQHHSDTLDKVTCVDRMYKEVSSTENDNSNLTLVGKDIIPYLVSYADTDFDKVIAHRVFEHLPYDTIGYALYLIRQILRPDGEIEIIVPDFKMVMDRFDTVDPNTSSAIDFNRMMIMAHTEIFNEPNDPHQSIWTERMARYYLELEGYWTVGDIDYTTLDNRDWYLKITATRK